MDKYVVFCPYFGKLPNYFNLWLKSCEYNSIINFIVITNDKKEYKTPTNVRIIHMEFDEFRRKVQQKFDFKISLESAYKLCDYKPVYGYIFSEYLNDCEYWGYCDLDMIFGDLKNYLPTFVVPKISHLGHLSLIHNEGKYTKIFDDINENGIDYRDILSSKIHFGFDEIGEYGINQIFKNNKLEIYPLENYIADISYVRPGMVLAIYDNGRFYPDIKKRIFSYDNGHVISYTLNGEAIEKQEYAYIHFQKRKMVDELSSHKSNQFIITPDGFIDYAEITMQLIDQYQDGKGYFSKKVIVKIDGINRHLKRNLEIARIKRSKVHKGK